MITVKLYYTEDDNRKINKRLTNELSLECVLLEPTDIKAPVLKLYLADYPRYNYMYIPHLQRYYYITDKRIDLHGLYVITGRVDVLMSFRGDIVNWRVVATKQTSGSIGDEYIDDASLVTENQMFTRVINFPFGFNDSSEYILITTG